MGFKPPMPTYEWITYRFNADGTMTVWGAGAKDVRSQLRRCGLNWVNVAEREFDMPTYQGKPKEDLIAELFAAMKEVYWKIRVAHNSTKMIPSFDTVAKGSAPLKMTEQARELVTQQLQEFSVTVDRIITEAMALMAQEEVTTDAINKLRFSFSLLDGSGVSNAMEDGILTLVADPYSHVVGIHDCGDSPLGVCVYNDDEDPSHDDCIFCHGPYERK